MSDNANMSKAGIESSAVSDKGGAGLNDGGAINLSREALAGGPRDSSPNIAVQAMRSAQTGVPEENGVGKMLNNGFSIEDKMSHKDAKMGEAVAVAGGMGAKAVAGGMGARAEAEGVGATAIAEGKGASAIAEGRNAHAVAEGPNAHAVAEGAGARAVAEDSSHKGLPHPDSPLKSDQPVLKGHPPGEIMEGKMAPPPGEKPLVGHARPIAYGQSLPGSAAVLAH
jgi:hypothetical protein